MKSIVKQVAITAATVAFSVFAANKYRDLRETGELEEIVNDGKDAAGRVKSVAEDRLDQFINGEHSSE